MKLSSLIEAAAPASKKKVQAGNNDALQRQLGTYLAIRPSQKTIQCINNFCQDIDLDGAVPDSQLHCTIMQSSKYVPEVQASGKLVNPLLGINPSIDIWETSNNKKALVLMFSCEALERYHNALMQSPTANFPWDSFIPHITLCYDLAGQDYNPVVLTRELERYLPVVELNDEYEEPLSVGDIQGRIVVNTPKVAQPFGVFGNQHA